MIRRHAREQEASGAEDASKIVSRHPAPQSKPPVDAAPVGTEADAATSNPGLSILMVASEAHPYAKTGGLAEVAAALPDALGRLGHRVTLVLPRYRGIDTAGSRSQIAVVLDRSSGAARRVSHA